MQLINILPYDELISVIAVCGEDGESASGSAMWYGNNHCSKYQRCMKDMTITEV